ncbi:hypothetical protein PGT21_012908 [Puccinia graminis f. sp. tritici]|uniref:Uncharacterized protein n=1 Tax=Puccinia graminis f. sp. tritici TaxID=56615 RepID=A0A5B0QAN2_PUCGR|nr:hypothetical protein PGT21_012908 [Puccinia graminis f. sp. tritici]
MTTIDKHNHQHQLLTHPHTSSHSHPSKNYESTTSQIHQSTLFKMNSYAIVPPNHATPSNISTDVHTNGLATGSAKLAPRHPLQNRLENTTTLPGQLKPSNLHLDILMGRDELIDESNAFLPNIAVGAEGSSHDKSDFHSQMEKKYKI